jgi:lipoprotein-anchoring transpeptidase ErfK/SrfK
MVLVGLAATGCSSGPAPGEVGGAPPPVATVLVAASSAPSTTTASTAPVTVTSTSRDESVPTSTPTSTPIPPTTSTPVTSAPVPSSAAPATAAPATTRAETPFAALHGPGVEAVAATAVRRDGVLEAWAARPEGPDPGPATWQVSLRNEFDGPLHLLVLDQVGAWLRVQLPVRPNGTEAWVLADEVTMAPVAHRIEIALGERRLRVVQGDRVVLERVVAVGRGSDPTPTGSYYLRDAFAWDADSVYGPYVLPLSAYSESIEVINGGEAVVAIHGTNRPDLLGRAVSLGCIRLHNDDITTLAYLVAPGSPVVIHP